MKGVVVTTDLDVYIQDFAQPLYETVGKVVGGYIERVQPMLLERPYCMLVNEEGLLLDSLSTQPAAHSTGRTYTVLRLWGTS